jgi:cytochrome c oxidase assembly factor 3, fungi type
MLYEAYVAPTRHLPQVMSPGLKRARAPYRTKNAILGISIFGVAAGIWAYSISAVKQDTFEDLDEEARALAQPGGANATSGITRAGGSAVGGGASSNIVTAGSNITSLQTTTTPLGVAAASKDHADASRRPPRGVIPALLDRTFPRLLDPATKTVIWGAPSVDALGQMGQKTRGF